MMQFYYKVLSRIYWFYKRIINESDPFMLYFYTSFAFMMIVVFYIWGSILFVERWFKLSINIGIIKYLLPLVLVASVILSYFYVNKSKLEYVMKNKYNEKFAISDFAVILYFILSILFCVLNVVTKTHST